MELTATAELNKTYMGKVQRITDFGRVRRDHPGTDGLLHVSRSRGTGCRTSATS